MLESMTASDFALWAAFYSDLPDRTEFYLSQICYLIAAAAGLKRKSGRPFSSPADFMPDLRSAREKIDDQRRAAEARAAFRAMRNGSAV
jgi:hypothetical protein